MKLLLVIGFVLFMVQRMASAGEWKPAKSPLMTRWAKDVSPENARPEYPRPQLVRKEWKNLNGLWDLTPAGGEAMKILVPFPMESALSGVGKHFDKSTYRRTFEVPSNWKGQRVLLHFGAVDFESVVSVNGKEVGKHVGGYDAFSFDITDALKDGSNELQVDVTDVTAETQARGKQTTKPEGIWYTPCSGIWQTVWIEPVPKTYIRSLLLEPDLEQRCVWITADVVGDSVDVKAETSLPVAPTSQPVSQEVTFKPGERTRLPVTGKGASLRPWSPDDPYLYSLKITAGSDSIESYAGMRKIEVASDGKVQRLKLNGKEIMMVGPLDQGFWPDGIYTAPTDEAMKYDIEITKKLGFNTIRKHVKVEPQTWYATCDRLGMIVWQDMPSALAKTPGDWQKQFESEMEQLVKQHINSPSILMWVPFNEGWGQDGAYGKEGTQRVIELVRGWDGSRLINNTSGWTDAGVGDVHDIHVYPGPAAPPLEGERAGVLGEFGGLGLPIEGHMWEAKHWGYQNMNDRKELTDKYVRLLGRMWQLHDDAGLCAGIYTQTTDVESESNGFLTYDREVLKMDEARVREANLGKGPRVIVETVVKTSRDEPAVWKYTFEKPADKWQMAEFDDSSWKSGQGGFGTEGTPGATIGTKWDSPDIWLRREIDLLDGNMADLELLVHHDDEMQIFINGVQAAGSRHYTTDYVERRINDNARKTLKPGKNVVAVHCHQVAGGQFIDVGFVKLTEVKGKN